MVARNLSKPGLKTATMPPRTSRRPSHTFVQAPTLPTAYSTLVPAYKSYRYENLVLRIDKWNPEYGLAVQEISAKRSASRLRNYVIPQEIERVLARLASTDSSSIRFGTSKEGHGYHGERGDFCLIGGSIERKNLTLFYRSLELIGGLAYDLCIINYVGLQLGIDWKTVTIHAARAHSFALKGNSNEKLYPKFRRILGI